MDEPLRALGTHRHEHADRPFGDAQAISAQTLRPFSIAGQEAATNLLVKARRALGHDDVDRARRLVDRAVALPYDEHEDASPVAFAVHMDLFCLVADALEEADVDDHGWLAAAEEVLDVADEAARCDMRDVLVTIDHDYSVSREEHRRIRAAISRSPTAPS